MPKMLLKQRRKIFLQNRLPRRRRPMQQMRQRQTRKRPRKLIRRLLMTKLPQTVPWLRRKRTWRARKWQQRRPKRTFRKLSRIWKAARVMQRLQPTI